MNKQDMIIWILYSISLLFILVWLIHIKRREKRNKEGLRNQSNLYRELYETSEKNNEKFTEEKHCEYINIIRNKKKKEIEHAIALISGNLQTISVDSIILSMMPVLFSFCSLMLANQISTVSNSDDELIAKFINFVVIGVYIIFISPAYVNVKRQQYFLQILQFELENKKEEEKNKLTIQKEKLEKEIEILKAEKKRKKGVHIIFYRK